MPSERIVLAGFSQGGAMSLQVGLRHAERLAGIMALSSYLLLEDSLGFVLRHSKNKRIARVQHPERGMGDASAVPVHVNSGDPMTGAEESVGESHQLERLDGSRVDCDRPRLRGAV